MKRIILLLLMLGSFFMGAQALTFPISELENGGIRPDSAMTEEGDDDTSSLPSGFRRTLEEKAHKVYFFKIEEEIAKPAALRVEKALAEAERVGADLIVVKINTFGGELESADKIRTAFLKCPMPIYAYIDNNAASAGALISIACNAIYMHSGSSIGAATVVDQMGQVQPDKYQSYMRSLMRTTAEARGYRSDIAEAMVDPDVVVPGISDSAKVLTFTTQEAIDNGYCAAQCESWKELLEKEGVKRYTIREQRYSFIDKLVGFLVSPAVSGILIMLIIGGIYFELKAPGIGLPSVIAIAGALLYFAPLYLEGLAANWEILLFVVGLALIAVEIFVIPGFGIAGVSGICCVVVGLAFSMIGNVGFDFSHVPVEAIGESFLVVLLAMMIAFPVCIVLCKKLFESNIFGGLALNTVQDNAEGYTVAENGSKGLVGSEGVATTILRPAGKVEIDGRIYDAMSAISYIEKGERVRVKSYENNTLVVVKA